MTEQEKRDHAEKAGKGKTRVEIAREALERAEAKVEACRERLEAALTAEKVSREKNKGKGRAKLEKTAKTLREMGLEEEAKKVEARIADLD